MFDDGEVGNSEQLFSSRFNLAHRVVCFRQLFLMDDDASDVQAQVYLCFAGRGLVSDERAAGLDKSAPPVGGGVVPESVIASSSSNLVQSL